MDMRTRVGVSILAFFSTLYILLWAIMLFVVGLIIYAA